MDTFDYAMDNSWDQIDYLEWYTGEHVNSGGWSIGNWDGFICLPNPTSGLISGIDVENYVPGKNVKYDAPYPRVVDMVKYWYNDLPSGTYPAPDVWYNNVGYDDVGFATPGTPDDEPVLNGKLRMKSINGSWEHAGNTGPFLYKMAEGNFSAMVEIVGFDNFWWGLGGLMARVPNPNGDGAMENHVQVQAFPMVAINRIQNTANGSSVWSGVKEAPLFDYLKITRLGSQFYFYAGERFPGEEAGGSLAWTLLGSVDRPDFPAELEVGIFQANFIDDWSTQMEFDNFLLVPEPATITLLGLGGLFLIRRRK